MLARHGVRRSGQTLCDWTLGTAELLAPLMAPPSEPLALGVGSEGLAGGCKLQMIASQYNSSNC